MWKYDMIYQFHHFLVKHSFELGINFSKNIIKTNLKSAQNFALHIKKCGINIPGNIISLLSDNESLNQECRFTANSIFCNLKLSHQRHNPDKCNSGHWAVVQA